MPAARSVIKIEPLFATDSTQVRALLRYQNEPVPYESFCAEESLLHSGLMFWQHWLPCRWHVAPSVYVAKEDGVILALISVANYGRAKACWRIEHLVVHPYHRGRGIAQELLRYVFALFGSQGVSHFLAEVSIHNDAALSLLASCGFRRATRISHYRLESAASEIRANAPLPESPPASSHLYRLARPDDQQAIYQLHQDALPADLRLIYNYLPEDFAILETQIEFSSKVFKHLAKRKTWYWVSEDTDRKVLTSAVKVTTHREGDYHIEFAIHPGWTHLAAEAVSFIVNSLANVGITGIKGIVIAKAYEYQSSLGQALEDWGQEREGEYFLMTREHWLRAQKPRRLKLKQSVVGIPSLANPAINLPRSQ